MNRKQLIVLCTTIILLGLSELFPPWLYEDGWTSEKHSAGYHFITKEPERKPIRELKDVFTLPDNGPPRNVHVQRDVARIYGQRLTLLFLAIGLLLVLSNRRSSLRVALGGLSLIAGVSALGLLVWYASLPRWY